MLCWFGLFCVESSSGFNLALTSLFFRDWFVLNAITGCSGKISFNVSFFAISFQCFFNMCLILCMSSQNCVVNTSLFCFCLLLDKAIGLLLNLISFTCLRILLCILCVSIDVQG